MSDDPLNDMLGGGVPQGPTALHDALRAMPAITPMLEPKILILCATSDYTVDDMIADKPEITRQWAEQLHGEGHHATSDAIEVSYNAAGPPFPDEHAAHPHLAMTCFVARGGRG